MIDSKFSVEQSVDQKQNTEKTEVEKGKRILDEKAQQVQKRHNENIKTYINLMNKSKIKSMARRSSQPNLRRSKSKKSLDFSYDIAGYTKNYHLVHGQDSIEIIPNSTGSRFKNKVPNVRMNL